MANEPLTGVDVVSVTPDSHMWMSIEEAATALNVSTSTIHRRIAAGGVESRKEDGHRLVLIARSDVRVMPPADSQQLSARESRNESHVTVAAGDVASEVSLTLMELATQARETLAIMSHLPSCPGHRRTRGGWLGWAAATLIAGGLTVTLTLTAAWRASDRTAVLEAQRRADVANVARARAEADRNRAIREMDRALAQVDAQAAAAQISGSATTRPAARPSGWVVKLASVFERDQ